jgi:hypothetical protein
MNFILDEAVIRRHVGGPMVMRDQLQHLLHWANLAYVTIQIMRFTDGAHSGLNLPRFVHLEFADPNDDDVVYLEGPEERLLEDPESTGPYLSFFFDLQTLAATETESGDLLADALTSFDEAPTPRLKGASSS